MTRRIGLLCIPILLLAATIPVRAQQGRLRSLQILVEGDQQSSLSIIEALRRNSSQSDLNLEFAGGVGDRYDLRLIINTGSGQSGGSSRVGTSAGFSYFTAVALAPDGKLLFTVSQTGMSAQDAAVAVIRKIYSEVVMPGKQPTSDLSGSPEVAPSAEPAGAIKSTALELPVAPAEPGVYYRDRADWIRMKESSPSDVIAKGLGKSMLTLGAAGIQQIEIYSDPSAEVQLSTRQPEFYVRGIAVSKLDFLILRLKRKKDHREAQLRDLSHGRPPGHRPENIRTTGRRPQDLHRVAVTRLYDGVYKITPASELKPGEYLLLLDTGSYEFGIRP